MEPRGRRSVIEEIRQRIIHEHIEFFKTGPLSQKARMRVGRLLKSPTEFHKELGQFYQVGNRQDAYLIVSAVAPTTLGDIMVGDV
jgi:hypothetical protein